MAQIKHDKSKERIELVEKMAQYGVPHKEIACLIGCCEDTLVKYYQFELDRGRAVANAKIGERLFLKAMEGDTTALIFWAKARMRWRTEDKLEKEENVKASKVTVRKVSAKKRSIETWHKKTRHTR